MPDETTAAPTDWPSLRSALAALGGDAWDDESERLDALWKAEYRAAFVDYALTRKGWDRENAEAWAGDLVADALGSCGNDRVPAEVAQIDVHECEVGAAREF